MAFAMLAAINPGRYLLAAPRMPQVYRLVATLKHLYGDEVVERRNEKRAYRGESEFYLYAGADAGSEMSLRGPRFRGALIDEAVGVHPDFLAQAILRCSKEPMRVVLLTNPDSPTHPLKTGWIDKAGIDPAYAYTAFTPADNPSLPPDYVPGLERDLSGVMKRRMLHGEWAMASGAIYGSSAVWRCEPSADPIVGRWLGVDYGHVNPTHAVLLVERKDEDDTHTRFVEREWRHEGPELSIEEKAAAILDALSPEGERLDGVFVDPSAAGIIDAFRMVRPGLSVFRGYNKVESGIQVVQTALESGRLFVSPTACPVLLREMEGYVYDEKALLRGKQEPRKVDDHGCDALRYAVASLALGGRRKVRVRDRTRRNLPD